MKQYQTLPEIPSSAHIPTMQCFQQLVELKESAVIMKEINGPNKNQCISDIKNILSTWRDRLPNHWDDVLVWNDLLTWRQHVFSLINTAFLSLAEVSLIIFI